MDILAPISMKNVANCDKWRELQNKVNRQGFECTLHLGDKSLRYAWLSVTDKYINFKKIWRSLHKSPLKNEFLSRKSSLKKVTLSRKMVVFLWKNVLSVDRLFCSGHLFLFDIPQLKQDYPLNLSILISGGKENNSDSLSNGEWTGKSSDLKSGSQFRFPEL